MQHPDGGDTDTEAGILMLPNQKLKPKGSSKKSVKQHQSQKGKKHVDCEFMCTCTSDDVDPVRGAPHLIPWGRGSKDRLADGSVLNLKCDYYCERVYQNFYKHQYNRLELQETMGRDKSVLDDFMQHRTKMIDNAKQGKRSSAKDHKETVTLQRGRDERLIRPKDAFWSLAKYRKKFGSPSANRKRGHNKTVYMGMAGVIVPHESDSDEPTAMIDRSLFTSTKHPEYLHDKSYDDDTDVALIKFDDVTN